MVSIVTARNLFGHSVIKDALNVVEKTEQEADGTVTEVDDGLDDDEQVVIFRLDKEEIGAPIASVQEIVRVPEQSIRVRKLLHLSRESSICAVQLRFSVACDRSSPAPGFQASGALRSTANHGISDLRYTHGFHRRSGNRGTENSQVRD